jgi:hypothetical protein
MAQKLGDTSNKLHGANALLEQQTVWQLVFEGACIPWNRKAYYKVYKIERLSLISPVPHMAHPLDYYHITPLVVPSDVF